MTASPRRCTCSGVSGSWCICSSYVNSTEDLAERLLCLLFVAEQSLPLGSPTARLGSSNNVRHSRTQNRSNFRRTNFRLSLPNFNFGRRNFNFSRRNFNFSRRNSNFSRRNSNFSRTQSSASRARAETKKTRRTGCGTCRRFRENCTMK
jgi:hypothetical protein